MRKTGYGYLELARTLSGGLRVSLFLTIAAFFGGINLFAQAPVFKSVSAGQSTVGQFERFELQADPGVSYGNPYDYEEIAVRCVFRSPGGKSDTVDGYYMQDYVLNSSDGSLAAKGKGGFRVRYTPRETGRWEYHLFCVTRAGRVAGPAGSFQCKTSTLPGFIRTNGTHYLSYDKGAQYIPVGENMGWAHKNAYLDFHQWVERLAANKGNFIRVWMPSWGLGLEWQDGRNGYAGLKRYKQESAYYLDWLIEYCREKGVYIMLSLNHHGQVSTKVDPNWNESPYNVANGGPCRNTWDFFTEPIARQMMRNRLRYIVARYGYSANIMSWELFNEVEWTDDFARHKKDITDWHREMAGCLQSKDVNKHLITTSYASADNDPATWELPGIDFTQTHFYSAIAGLDSLLSSAGQSYLIRYRKPTLTGEFGLSGDGSKLPVTDPQGVYVHNSLWGTLLGGGLGAGLPWYWDNYIDPQNLYKHFQALSDFVSGLSLVKDRYAVAEGRVTGGGKAFQHGTAGGDQGGGKEQSDESGLRAAVLKSADSFRIAGWVLNKNYNWKYVKEHGKPAPVIDAVVEIPAVKNGQYEVRWSDCETGRLVSTVKVIVTDHRMRLVCPVVVWDLGVVAEPVR